MSQVSDAAIVSAGAEVLREGADCLSAAAAGLGADFVATSRVLAASDSFTMVVGAGKSGYIGRKFAASLLSTGHGAAFVHPTDAIHGDIGIAEHATLAILLSHSGNTEELVTLVPLIKQFGVASALIARDRDCRLAEYVDWIVATEVAEEAGIGRLAPTSSSTTTLALCDALMMASLALRGFTGEQFRRYHPGGMLGQQLRKVGDVMMPAEQLVWLDVDAGLAEVVERISRGGHGYALVSGNTSAGAVPIDAVGIITDGDIRRAVRQGGDLAAKTAGAVMSPGPKTISRNALAIEAIRAMEESAITSLLCTDESGNVVGAVDIHDVVSRELGLVTVPRRT